MSHIRYERHGHTALITIDRPEVRNCIAPQTHRELKAAWQQFLDEDDAYVGVLTGAGAEAFCAGGDLKAGQRGETTLDDAEAFSARRDGRTCTSRRSRRSTAPPTPEASSGRAGPTSP